MNLYYKWFHNDLSKLTGVICNSYHLWILWQGICITAWADIRGVVKAKWITKDPRQIQFLLLECYWRISISKSLQNCQIVGRSAKVFAVIKSTNEVAELLTTLKTNYNSKWVKCLTTNIRRNKSNVQYRLKSSGNISRTKDWYKIIQITTAMVRS